MIWQNSHYHGMLMSQAWYLSRNFPLPEDSSVCCNIDMTAYWFQSWDAVMKSSNKNIPVTDPSYVIGVKRFSNWEYCWTSIEPDQDFSKYIYIYVTEHDISS